MSMFKGPSTPSSQFNFMPMSGNQLGAPGPLNLAALPQVPQITVPQYSPMANIPAPPPQSKNDLLLQLLSNFKA